MRLSWLVTLRSSLLALLLHIIAAVLLFVSLELTPEPVPVSGKEVNIVNAVSVDKEQVEQELKRLQESEKREQEEKLKQLEELKKKAKLEKQKAEEARKRRLEEEKELTAARKKKELEQQRRELEQKKLARLEEKKAELERQRRIEEEEQKRKAEEERKRKEAEMKRLEEEKRKREEELKRLEEEKRKAEEEQKRKEAEKALQEQLVAEQAKQDASLLEKIVAGISNKVENSFNKTGLPENLTATLRVKLLPGGDVIDVAVSDSSGNDIFDRRAVTAVQKSSPLPVPDDIGTFERLGLRDISFKFKP